MGWGRNLERQVDTGAAFMEIWVGTKENTLY